MMLDASQPAPSNKPAASRPSPRSWRSGATTYCNRGGSVFLIMFKSGQALPLPGGRFSCPRIGREEGREWLRDMYRSWPQTRLSHGHDPVQCRPRTQTVHVHEQSASAGCPRPQPRSQTVHIHALATASVVRELATAVVVDCPQPVPSCELSTATNWLLTRFGRCRRPAANNPRRSIALSAWASVKFPVQIQMIPFYDHV
jgi:hypothetical protein